MIRALWLVLLLAGCTGTETGNPNVRAQMGFVGRSSMPLVAGVPGDGAPVTIDALEIGLAALDLGTDCATRGDGTPELAAVGMLDLLDPDANVRDFEIAPTAFCSMRVDLDGLALHGTRADGTPFDWATSAPVSLRSIGGDLLFLVDEAHPA